METKKTTKTRVSQTNGADESKAKVERRKKTDSQQKTDSTVRTKKATQPRTRTARPEKNTGKVLPSSQPTNEKDQSKHVLFVCSEAQPFVGTGGLGDVMGSLPQAINKCDKGVEVRVVLPLYETMNPDFREKLEFLFHINTPVSWRNQYCGVFRLEHGGAVYYFLDNEYYFKRPSLYGYYDDAERFAFLSRASLEILSRLDWRVDVLHCHDWHTALVPIYYKLYYQFNEGFLGIKTVFTIHNIEYQGKYDKSITEDVLGIPFYQYGSIEYDGSVNLMKGALDYSDVITTVSPTYARELCDPYYANGLEKIIQKNSHKLTGILNGIDTDLNNPATNPSLFANYDIDSIEKKKQNKTELQKMIGLPESSETPLIAIVSRLVQHKGMDIVRAALNSILSNDIQFVILGTGVPSFEEYFSNIQLEYNNKISTIIAYNKDLSQKIYASADLFLMPSKSEPCGLSQMIAMRYGTVPIVRATGGLADTVTDRDQDGGNGFVFCDYNSFELVRAVDRALDLYKNNKQEWNKLVATSMSMDNSWQRSAADYIKLYR